MNLSSIFTTNKKFNSVFLVIVVFSIITLSTINYIADADAFSIGNHESITSDALSSFLKSDVYTDIEDEHLWVDVAHQFNDAYHFDNCVFQGGTERINANYVDTLIQLDPNNFDLDDSADQFGQVLHPVQDFYAHSNWVESGQTSIIDNGLGMWTVLTPYTTVNELIILQGETVPSNLSLTRNSDKTVTVHNNDDGSDSLGLISGSVYDSDDCPDDATIGHWDSHLSAWGQANPPFNEGDDWDGLNKDDISRFFFPEARSLAVEQSTHEWCRLITMVEDQYGQSGVDKLFDEWVDASKYNDALNACPTLTICAVPTFGDWTITKDCALSNVVTAPANVIIKNNSVLTIASTASLDVDLVNYNITVESGSGVLIVSGSKIY